MSANSLQANPEPLPPEGPPQAPNANQSSSCGTRRPFKENRSWQKQPANREETVVRHLVTRFPDETTEDPHSSTNDTRGQQRGRVTLLPHSDTEFAHVEVTPDHQNFDDDASPERVPSAYLRGQERIRMQVFQLTQQLHKKQLAYAEAIACLEKWYIDDKKGTPYRKLQTRHKHSIKYVKSFLPFDPEKSKYQLDYWDHFWDNVNTFQSFTGTDEATNAL